GRIDQGIDFGDDTSGPAALGVACFAINEGNAVFRHVARSDEQWLVVRPFRVCGEKVENVVHRGRDRFIAGKQAKVAVKTRGRWIVVSRAEVGIAADFSVLIFADDERDLRVRLEPNQTVKNLDASVFKAARPADVGGFIEAGFQFDDYGYFFLGSGFEQCARDRRI